MRRYLCLIPAMLFLFFLLFPTLTIDPGAILKPFIPRLVERLPPYNSGLFSSVPGWHIPPGNYLRLILFFLLVPSPPLIYLGLLAQVYRYAYQLGERLLPWQLAGKVVLPIVLIQATGIYFWIRIADFGLSPIPVETQNKLVIVLWLVVTLSSTLLAVSGAIHISRQRGFSEQFQRKIVRASIEVSLIVALGIAGGMGFWWLITAGIIGFAVYRFGLSRYLSHHDAIVELDTLDLLALDQVTAAAIGFDLLLICATIFRWYSEDNIVRLSLVWIFATIAVVLWQRTNRRMLLDHAKKKNTREPGKELMRYFMLAIYTAVWIILTGLTWHFITQTWSHLFI